MRAFGTQALVILRAPTGQFFLSATNKAAAGDPHPNWNTLSDDRNLDCAEQSQQFVPWASIPSAPSVFQQFNSCV